MNQEPLMDEQIEKIAYIAVILENRIKKCYEVMGVNPNPDIDIPSYCLEMARNLCAA